jgi:hypothetical protein
MFCIFFIQQQQNEEEKNDMIAKIEYHIVVFISFSDGNINVWSFKNYQEILRKKVFNLMFSYLILM